MGYTQNTSKEKKYSLSKKSLHSIIHGGNGSGYGLKLNKNQTIWFLGTDYSNHYIKMVIETKCGDTPTVNKGEK